MNPSTALATAIVDELIRCGLREAVLSPGSRSAPLALELYRRAQAGDLRLHVRIDERSAAFLALGLAKASRTPVAVVCTSGTAAAHFHAAVIEADQAGVPLLVLTADRPPELRETGASQTIDQLKLYGSAVRWFCEVGVPEVRSPMGGYWRSATCRAWGVACGTAGGMAGPVHLNLALREPLVPDAADPASPGAERPGAGGPGAGGPGAGGPGAGGPDAAGPGSLLGRPGGLPWTWFGDSAELSGSDRGVIVCGDGDYDPGPLLELAGAAGWPVLAEPSSNARHGPNALSAYQYLLAAPGFVTAHRPELIVSAGRPGLSRGQLALLRGMPGEPPARHVVIAQGPGRWADPARTATEVVSAVRLVGHRSGGSGWLEAWLRAEAAVRPAVDAVLDADGLLSEPRLARDLAAGLPSGALLWAASSLPIRDLDLHMAPRADIRVLASRGASGIDGLVSSAIGAALAHQAAGGGQAFALLGDLALLHDAPGLFTGPAESLPALCIVVVNNDGGGIFSGLEQAAIPGPFERVFGTPHGTRIGDLAAAAGVPFQRIERPADLPEVLAGITGARPGDPDPVAGSGARSGRGGGLRLLELRTDRHGQATLRAKLAAAAAAALD